MWTTCNIIAIALILGLPVISVTAQNRNSSGSADVWRTAIFVNNFAGARFNDRVLLLENQVASRLASGTFQVVSREDVQKALKVFPSTGNADPNRNTLGTEADRLISDSSSVLRLSQAIGVDFILIVNINSLNSNETHFKDDRTEFKNVEYVLQVNYKVLEGVTGSAVVGDDFEITRRFKVTPSLQRNDGNLVNELLRSAANKVCQSLLDRVDSLRVFRAPDRVEITIVCGIRGLDGTEISLPDIRVTESNEVIKGSNRLPVQAIASVELDGVVVGSTPSKLKVIPGLHKLRLTREGFNDFEATINAQEGLMLTPSLQMSEEGFRRWREILSFLNGLDTARKLTDAQVKVLEGYATFLKNSRYSISHDHKSDIKVNTTEGIKFNFHKSLY
jgi:hypothetical protein